MNSQTGCPAPAFLRLLCIWLAVCCLLAVPACRSTNYPPDVPTSDLEIVLQRKTRFYADKDGTTDARKNFRLNDRKIYVAIGSILFYPGLSDEQGAALTKRYGSRRLKGIADKAFDVQVRWFTNANGYAQNYNREMASLIAAHPRQR